MKLEVSPGPRWHVCLKERLPSLACPETPISLSSGIYLKSYYGSYNDLRYIPELRDTGVSRWNPWTSGCGDHPKPYLTSPQTETGIMPEPCSRCHTCLANSTSQGHKYKTQKQSSESCTALTTRMMASAVVGFEVHSCSCEYIRPPRKLRLP